METICNRHVHFSINDFVIQFSVGNKTIFFFNDWCYLRHRIHNSYRLNKRNTATLPALQLRHNQITRPWKYAIAGFCCKRNIKRIKTKGNCAFPTAPVAYLSHFLHATSFLRRINHLHLFFMASLSSSQSVFSFPSLPPTTFPALPRGYFPFWAEQYPLSWHLSTPLTPLGAYLSSNLTYLSPWYLSTPVSHVGTYLSSTWLTIFRDTY